jgi:hypothetical protein
VRTRAPRAGAARGPGQARQGSRRRGREVRVQAGRCQGRDDHGVRGRRRRGGGGGRK